MTTSEQTPRKEFFNKFYLVVDAETKEEADRAKEVIYQTIVDYGLKVTHYPRNAFNRADNARQMNLDFGDMLRALQEGCMARLPHWSEDVRIVLQQPSEDGSGMTYPYLYAESKYGRVPWKETFVELLAHCWEVMPYEPFQVKSNRVFAGKVRREDKQVESEETKDGDSSPNSIIPS